jgi:hypothetical protein
MTMIMPCRRVAGLLRQQSISVNTIRTLPRFYFTNGKATKQNDPYAILGLQWGEGVTTSEIKTAFRTKARELHPDVNKTDSPEKALLNFQRLQKAYETLVKNITGNEDGADFEEWRNAIWMRGDRIAMDRTDVAGVKKNRPAPPASSKVYSKVLGHPQGVASRGEYLGASQRKSSSVGSGRNKWVTPKEFQPWNPESEKEKK